MQKELNASLFPTIAIEMFFQKEQRNESKKNNEGETTRRPAQRQQQAGKQSERDGLMSF